MQLTGRLHLWQRRRGHRSATDDVLCAWAGLRARPEARRVLDLGAGQGSVTLMLAGSLAADAHVVAVEAQEISFRLLARNIAENGLEGRISAIRGDLREVGATELGRGAPFELVTGSPPFMPPGSGTLPADPQRAAGRFELRGGIEAYARAAARWLTPGGAAVLLMDGASEARSREALAGAGLALDGLVRVLPRAGAGARYIIYEARAGAAEGEARDLSLTIRDGDGAWTPEFCAIRERLDLPGSDG